MSFEEDPWGPDAPSDPEVASLIEPLRAVREELVKVEEALAIAMIAIARVDCNSRKDDKCLEAIAWARDVSVEALNDLANLRSDYSASRSSRKAETRAGAGGARPPTPRQIAKSAAYLVATADDARLDEDALPLIVREALRNLRAECEAAGLMARYIYPGHPTYRVLE